MVSTTSLKTTETTGAVSHKHARSDSIIVQPQISFRVRPNFKTSAGLPVDPPRPFLRLDVDIIVIDINLGNLHLEVVGEEPDGFPHSAEAGTPRRLKQRGRGGRAWRGESRENSECFAMSSYHNSYLLILHRGVIH